MMKEHTDAQLVAMARADDTYAFQALVERHHFMAFYLARRTVHNEETAHELVQEAFLQAYLSLNHLREAHRFKSWLYGIILHVCHNWQRRNANSTNMLSLENMTSSQVEPSPNHNEIDPQELAEKRELQAQILTAIETLTPKNQLVAYLFYYEDQSIQEIANKLNISLTTVKNRLHKSRQQLKTHLQMHYPEIIIERRKKQTMLQLKLVETLQHKPTFARSTTTLILLDEHQRAWLPQVTETSNSIRFLLDMVHALQGKIEKIAIDTLYADILYAKVHINGQRGQHIIKAQINDALQLAIYEPIPISASATTLDQHAIYLSHYGRTQQSQIANIKYIAEQAPYRLQPHANKKLNLDFSAGLRDWTLFTPHHTSTYTLDTQHRYTNTASLALTLHQNEMPHSVLLAYKGFPADPYRGKRLRATAYLKAEGLQQPIFHIRISGPVSPNSHTATPREQHHSSTEHIHIAHTQEWTAHQLIIDVPEHSAMISLAFLMRGIGQGTFWLDGIQLEIVDKG